MLDLTRTLFDRIGFIFSATMTAVVLGLYLAAVLFDSAAADDAAILFPVVFALLIVFGIGQVPDLRPNPNPVLALNPSRIRLARWTLTATYALVPLHYGLAAWGGRQDESLTLWNVRAVTLTLMLALCSTLAVSYGLCVHNVWPWLIRWKHPLRELRRRKERNDLK